MERKILVATYGTLRLDQGNYNHLLKNKSDYIGKTSITGFDIIPGWGFPYAREKENKNEGIVVVDVFKVDPQVFKNLDRLEGYPSFYDRKLINTEFGEAWIYFYNQAKGEPLPDGDWVKFISQKRDGGGY
jgi:gamma-glutamylcyclotransferase (GGCT)/AIG2-like uncharacterized protein YtfP